MTQHRKLLTGSALAVLAVLLVAVILVCNALFRGARMDLTQNHLYSLSQGTKNILSSIDEPIHLYLFYSDKGTQNLPQLRTYAQRVPEMLGEMTARAGGKIHLDVIDPLPFSEDEDRATGFGLQAVPTGQGGESIFFGLAGTNSTNGKSVIPFLQGGLSCPTSSRRTPDSGRDRTRGGRRSPWYRRCSRHPSRPVHTR